MMQDGEDVRSTGGLGETRSTRVRGEKTQYEREDTGREGEKKKKKDDEKMGIREDEVKK